MSGSANSMPGTFDASPGDVEAENARLRRLVAVRRYMEGSIVHPGFLLPWEEERSGRNDRRYFVDLVTGEITWKEPKDKIIRLFPCNLAAHSTEGERSEELRVRVRALHVEYWRFYLTQRGALLKQYPIKQVVEF